VCSKKSSSAAFPKSKEQCIYYDVQKVNFIYIVHYITLSSQAHPEPAIYVQDSSWPHLKAIASAHLKFVEKEKDSVGCYPSYNSVHLWSEQSDHLRSIRIDGPIYYSLWGNIPLHQVTLTSRLHMYTPHFSHCRHWPKLSIPAFADPNGREAAKLTVYISFFHIGRKSHQTFSQMSYQSTFKNFKGIERVILTSFAWNNLPGHCWIISGSINKDTLK